MIGDKIITYPVLYKWQKGKIAEKISKGACPHFEVIKNSVIYLNSTLADLSHGELYVARPDGMNERVMEEELYDFSVDDEYIYFTYCFDTIGAGLEGHALYRMDLNGNHMTRMAYQISSPILKGSHYNVRIENGWAIYSNYKIQIENEANGLEKVVLLENTDDDLLKSSILSQLPLPFLLYYLNTNEISLEIYNYSKFLKLVFPLFLYELTISYHYIDYKQKLFRLISRAVYLVQCYFLL
jgi:hypothetical protein